jgi:predicted house-cleaning noncanonical NTP pyrophosphatase (MazG superfamily)
VEYYKLDQESYRNALEAKLAEEAAEVDMNADPNQVLAEIADVQEVLDAMTTAIGKTRADREAAQAAKRERAGGFDEQLFVETVALPDGHPWMTYYRDNSDRYPEVR